MKIYLERARDRILKAHPDIKDGTPRAVILRWHQRAERQAFNHQPKEEAAA